MQDFEKNRVEYVTRLEEQVQHLQRQLGESSPLASRWTPEFNGEMGDHGGARLSMSFGGKRMTVSLTADALQTSDITSLTSSVVDTLCETLVKDRLREILYPEVERLVRSTAAVKGAGKW